MPRLYKLKHRIIPHQTQCAAVIHLASMTSSMFFVTFLLVVFSWGGSIASATTVPASSRSVSTLVLRESLPELEYYLHDNFVSGPDMTAVQVASADGTMTYSAIFGDFVIFDSILREGADPDSAMIGRSGGSRSVLHDLNNFITFVHDITLGDYTGTIAASGKFSFTQTTWQVAITGGTGSFQGANGYLDVSIVDAADEYIILKYLAYIDIPTLSKPGPALSSK